MEKKAGFSFVKTISLVMVFMLLGKVTGLFRDILIAGNYGTGTVEAKAFTFASLVPRVFLDIMFSSAISASFIPVFNEYLEKKDRKSAFSLANKFITFVLVFSSAFTVLAVLGSDFITSFNMDWSAQTRETASFLLKIMLPTIILSGTAFSLTGVLQSLGEFNIPAAMSVLSNLIVICYSLFFIDTFGLTGLSVAVLCGWGTQLFVQIAPLIKKGYLYRPALWVKDEGMKKIYSLMLPVLISTWIAPINLLVNTTVAGDSIAALNYANTLYSVVTGVFILSIANVVFPELSRISAAGDYSEFAGYLKSTLSGMMFLLLPMSVGLCLLSKPLIVLFFQYGMFNDESTELTSQALSFFSMGIVGFGFQTVLSRAFYAEKNGKIPLITGIIAIAVNAALSVALAGSAGIKGPAAASSISLTIAALLMFLNIYKRCKQKFNRDFFTGILKMAVCACVMGAAVCFVSGILSGIGGNKLAYALNLLVSTLTGVIVYVICAILLKINEINIFIGFFRKRANK